MSGQSIFRSPWYDVAVLSDWNAYKLVLTTHTNFLTTKALPHTYAHLSTSLPSILYAYCRNEKNLPFSEELKATEIGHLFEHILLEYACMQKLKYGYQQTEFEGRTDWNWKRDARGTFHITIAAAQSDWGYIEQALLPTHRVMQTLFLSCPKADSLIGLSAYG